MEAATCHENDPHHDAISVTSPFIFLQCFFLWTCGLKSKWLLWSSGCEVWVVTQYSCTVPLYINWVCEETCPFKHTVHVFDYVTDLICHKREHFNPKNWKVTLPIEVLLIIIHTCHLFMRNRRRGGILFAVNSTRTLPFEVPNAEASFHPLNKSMHSKTRPLHFPARSGLVAYPAFCYGHPGNFTLVWNFFKEPPFSNNWHYLDEHLPFLSSYSLVVSPWQEPAYRLSTSLACTWVCMRSTCGQ